MEKANVIVEGITPLLMHNPQLADAFNEYSLEIAKINEKHHSKRTKADILKRSELEYYGSLYFDSKLGPIVPAYMMEACIRDASKTLKSGSGKNIVSGVSIWPDNIKLEYDGPRTMSDLYADKTFIDYRSVKLNKTATIMRTRPKFNDWKLQFTIHADPDIIALERVPECLEFAGKLKAIGDYRPRFGRFLVKKFNWM